MDYSFDKASYKMLDSQKDNRWKASVKAIDEVPESLLVHHIAEEIEAKCSNQNPKVHEVGESQEDFLRKVEVVRHESLLEEEISEKWNVGLQQCLDQDCQQEVKSSDKYADFVVEKQHENLPQN